MPPDSSQSVLLWRLADTLLALPLDQVVEVGAMQADGSARARDRAVDLVEIPGTTTPESPRRAVIARSGDRWAALAADSVEGVRPALEHPVATPPWLNGLQVRHIRGILPLESLGLAALLDLEAVLARA